MIQRILFIILLSTNQMTQNHKSHKQNRTEETLANEIRRCSWINLKLQIRTRELSLSKKKKKIVIQNHGLVPFESKCHWNVTLRTIKKRKKYDKYEAFLKNYCRGLKSSPCLVNDGNQKKKKKQWAPKRVFRIRSNEHRLLLFPLLFSLWERERD